MKLEVSELSHQEQVKLTPEVEVDSTIFYLVRIDKEVVGYTESEECAKVILDSFAAREMERMTDEWTKVTREDLQDGKKIVLSTQQLGRVYHGSMLPTMVLDFIAAPHLNLLKERLSEDPPRAPPSPPPRPSPGTLRKMMEKHTAPVDDSDDSSNEEFDSSTDEDCEMEEEVDA